MNEFGRLGLDRFLWAVLVVVEIFYSAAVRAVPVVVHVGFVLLRIIGA
jgi:hypothetical protein